MRHDRVSQIRSFNRTVTQCVGALNDHFLGRDRPLGEARLLFEIGRDGADMRELRARLALDSGYLSRLIRSLERQGLVTAGSAEGDGRVRRARLTRAGLAEVQELDRRSDAFAKSILAVLDEPRREKLVAAMAEVERLLHAAALTIDVEPPTSPAARYCLDEYFRELARRFEGGFDPARSIPADASEFVPPRGVFVVARIHAKLVGCGGFRRTAPRTGYFKRMWVAPAARGMGVGRRILEVLEGHARRIGLSILQLETNKALTEAQALYRTCGYREVAPFNEEPYAHHWFEKRLRRSRRPRMRG